MLIELSSLNDLTVASFEEGGAIGKIEKSIISKDEVKILGFLVRMQGLFGGRKVASLEDILSIDQSGIVIRTVDSLVDPGEIVRIDEIIKSKFKLIGLPAKDKKMQSLGRITDALIEGDTGLVIRLYTKRYFDSLVFERAQIEKVNDKFVLINTDSKEKAAVWRKKTASRIIHART